MVPLLLSDSRRREVSQQGERSRPGREWRHHDVLPTGTGTAHSNMVTRWRSALTGQEVGR